MSVVITNKSAKRHRVQIRVNGRAAHGPFAVEFVAGTDPSLANTPSNPNAVTVQKDRFLEVVTVPPYSVLRVDLRGDRHDNRDDNDARKP